MFRAHHWVKSKVDTLIVHTFPNITTRPQMLQASVDFVMRNDPPDAAPPAKAN